MAEPEHITVQHLLVAFQGSGTGARRSKEEARTLAYDLMEQAKAGVNFDDLIKKHTDDSPPGIYAMANRGVRPAQGEYGRDSMVPAFGDTGFPLQVGEFGMADHDPRKSPYGWHIVKRIK